MTEQQKPAILFADDEEILRALAIQFLATSGYQIYTAANLDQLIAILEANSDHIKLTVLDWTLEGMRGVESYQELKKVAPSIPLIISSGYSVNQHANVIHQNGDHLLPKPYRMPELMDHIRMKLEE